MTMTLAATSIASPKLLTSACTISMLALMIACVMPDGTPSRIMLRRYSASGLTYSLLSVKISPIPISLMRQSIAEIICAITVASATPATPIFPTSSRSPTTLSPAQIMRNSKAENESPSPRRIPAKIL